jgi:hypothetical protein
MPMSTNTDNGREVKSSPELKRFGDFTELLHRERIKYDPAFNNPGDDDLSPVPETGEVSP